MIRFISYQIKRIGSITHLKNWDFKWDSNLETLWPIQVEKSQLLMRELLVVDQIASA